MGKIMYLWGEERDGQMGRADAAQFGLGGDTWVVGVPIPDTAVFPEFSGLNPDKDVPAYQGPCGMYQPGCGLENLLFAYGHDEYMYRMLVHDGTTIPKEGLAMIRYHSCYPLHKHGEYAELLADGDAELMKWVVEFNQFDFTPRRIRCRTWRNFGLTTKSSSTSTSLGNSIGEMNSSTVHALEDHVIV